MLRRENAGGFWRIRTKPLPPPPPPQILTQIQNLRTTLLNRPTSPPSARRESRYSRNCLTQSRPDPLSSSYRVSAPEGDRGGPEATPTEQSRRNAFTEGETQYFISPLAVREILDQVLSHNYDYLLPSSAARAGSGQAIVSGGTIDELPQFETASPLQEHKSNEGSGSDIPDEGVGSGAEILSPSTIQSDGDETLLHGQSRDDRCESLIDHSNDAIHATSQDNRYGDDGNDDYENGSGFGESGLFNHIRRSVDNSQNSQSAERRRPNQPDVLRPEVNDARVQEPNTVETFQDAVLAGNLHADTDTSILEHPAHVSSPTTIDQERLSDPECRSIQPIQGDPCRGAPQEERQLGVSSKASSELRFGVSTLAEEAIRVPTTTHYHAIKHIASAELIAPISEFLQQNSARTDDFLARRQVYQVETTLDTKHKPIRTVFSPAWDNREELNFLTHAIVWLDELLATFRAAIVEEDLTNLKPYIEQTVREFEATGILSRACTEQSLSIKDREIAQQFTDDIVKIQNSNSVRRQLLEHINIDVPTFENLLLSAENIRYRRDLGRKYGQKDDLVDSLRRIYSTITCTIPVCLPEQDWVEKAPQPHKITYGDGPFRNYELPGRPEILEHASVSISRLSGTRAIGIQMSERQTPLSQEYWDNLHYETLGMLRKAELQGDSRRSSTECSDSSTTTIELDLGNQNNKNKKRSKFCMNVNKPGGWSNPSSCGAEYHHNEGKYCKNGDACRYGPGRCAYIHGTPPAKDPRKPSTTRTTQPTPSQRRDSVAVVDRRLRDLRDPKIFPEVLANPKAFRVCSWINKFKGCTAIECSFNHTLAGIVCADYQNGRCPRDFNCPLVHTDIDSNTRRDSREPHSTADLPGHFPADRSDASPSFPTPSSFGTRNEGPRTIAQQPEPMDHEQTAMDRGLPPSTPTAPRSMNLYPQSLGADSGWPYTGDSHRNNRKRTGSSDQPQPLIERSTLEGRPLADVLRDRRNRKRRNEDVQMTDMSDYPGDDEGDMYDVQDNNRSGKKQKKDER
jgi:hypothetical protein